jgi:hypothetical protein
VLGALIDDTLTFLFDNGCNVVSLDDDTDGGDLILLAVRCDNTIYDDDRSDLIDDTSSLLFEDGCTLVSFLAARSDTNNKLKGNDFNSEDGDIILDDKNKLDDEADSEQRIITIRVFIRINNIHFRFGYFWSPVR